MQMEAEAEIPSTGLSNWKVRSIACRASKARRRGQASHQDRDRVCVRLGLTSKYNDHHGHDHYEKYARRHMTAARKECQHVLLNAQFATMDFNCRRRLPPPPQYTYSPKCLKRWHSALEWVIARNRMARKGITVTFSLLELCSAADQLKGDICVICLEPFVINGWKCCNCGNVVHAKCKEKWWQKSDTEDIRGKFMRCPFCMWKHRS